jgi:hypothetical protein
MNLVIIDVGECQEVEFPTEIEIKVSIPRTSTLA